jgi:hypothetical protein
MDLPYLQRVVLFGLVAASVLLAACSEPLSVHDATEAHDSQVLLNWGEIGPATGGGGSCGPWEPTGTDPIELDGVATDGSIEQAGVMDAECCSGWIGTPPPSCCAYDNSLPGCVPIFPPPCTAEQTAIAAEYSDTTYKNKLRPACTDFTNSGGSALFPWSELNGRGYLSRPPFGNPHYDNGGWGMINPRLVPGLEATRTAYNRGGIALSSGFRCPHGNKAVNGVKNSPHTHGTAADMYSAAHGGVGWSLVECERLKEAAESTEAGGEALPCDHYLDTDRHLHVKY